MARTCSDQRALTCTGETSTCTGNSQRTGWQRHAQIKGNQPAQVRQLPAQVTHTKNRVTRTCLDQRESTCTGNTSICTGNSENRAARTCSDQRESTCTGQTSTYKGNSQRTGRQGHAQIKGHQPAQVRHLPAHVTVTFPLA